jgi:hypothetical protein
MPSSMRKQSTRTVDPSPAGRSRTAPLVNLALSGLVPMFDRESQLFCNRRWMSPAGLVNDGLSRRYTIMSLLGLVQSEAYGHPALFDHRAVLGRLVSDTGWIDNAGDLGLLLWLGAVQSHGSVTDPCAALSLRDVLGHYPDAHQGSTMQLAWLLAGLAHRELSVRGHGQDEADTAFEAYKLIIGNQGPHGIFGHSATYRSPSGLFRGHIGSFADQVYPIYALAKFGQAYGVQPALQAAQRCAEAICRMQGPSGQWWWHYDARSGRVFQRYPVYAVHQDGMAPMALFALGEAMRSDFREPVYKGLAWIGGNNELGRELRDASSGLIWRSMYREASWSKRIDEVREFLSPGRAARPVNDLKVLLECRPYHLGWLLYAFAGRDCD